MDGRAAAAATYPEALCKCICVGIKAQLEHDRMVYSSVKQTAQYASLDFIGQAKYCHNDDSEVQCYDDVTGTTLDPELMRKARKVEMDFCS